MRREGLPELGSDVGRGAEPVETVVVERIEEFTAELEASAIADLDVLDRGKIP